jgi:predicted  nucleic acid-binding Zn-ribbon protein
MEDQVTELKGELEKVRVQNDDYESMLWKLHEIHEEYAKEKEDEVQEMKAQIDEYASELRDWSDHHDEYWEEKEALRSQVVKLSGQLERAIARTNDRKCIWCKTAVAECAFLGCGCRICCVDVACVAGCTNDEELYKCPY